MDPALASGITALRQGRARVDLSGWTKVEVSGHDARTFLGDLVSGDVAGLKDGRSTRSLLLTPTGRVRADFTVARPRGAPGPPSYLLVQSPGQPARIDTLLSPYVLSAEVDLADRRDLSLSAELFTGERAVTNDFGQHMYAPGALGAGIDLIGGASDELELVGDEALEAWRILEGRPRFPVDFGTDSLPAEAGLDEAIDYTKGCFVGQESVAKVRNLGHPPVVVLAVRSDLPISAGSAVVANSTEAGIVTSATEDPDGGFGALARVRWEHREADLRTADGAELRRPERP